MSLLPTLPPSSLRRKEICCAIYIQRTEREMKEIKLKKAEQMFPSVFFLLSPSLTQFPSWFLLTKKLQSVLLEQFQMYTHT